MIDRFELVGYVVSFELCEHGKNLHSRKHPLYLDHTPMKSGQSEETSFISLSISLQIP